MAEAERGFFITALRKRPGNLRNNLIKLSLLLVGFLIINGGITPFDSDVLSSNHTIDVVALFDPNNGDTPESIVIDKKSNKFISMALTGEIRKIASDGTQSTHAILPVGIFNLMPFSGIMGALALDDSDGTIYASLVASEPANRGIWRVAPDGSISLLANLPANSLPNGIALRGDDLFVADSENGVIWKVSTINQSVAIWAEDPLLKPSPGHVFPGPNGLQIFRGEVYVANSDTARMLAIQINPDGTAGNIRVHAAIACDDFAFDIRGDIYCTTDPANTLVQIHPDGSSEVLLTAADGLDGPTAAAFGNNRNEMFDLFITNAAFPFFSTTHRPSLLKMHLDVRGAVKPQKR